MCDSNLKKKNDRINGASYQDLSHIPHQRFHEIIKKKKNENRREINNLKLSKNNLAICDCITLKISSLDVVIYIYISV